MADVVNGVTRPEPTVVVSVVMLVTVTVPCLAWLSLVEFTRALDVVCIVVVAIAHLSPTAIYVL